MESKQLRLIEWMFRAAVAACFIGHGAFGIITKDAWLPYFAVVGIGADTAYQLMPLVGLFDIGVGLIALLSPRRLVLLHMVVWGVWTASLRPLSGQSAWELVERAGNYGVPLAFLLAVGWTRAPRQWLTVVRSSLDDPQTIRAIAVVLRVTTVMLLIGHGALALAGPETTVATHLRDIGLPGSTSRVVGLVDIWLAVAVALGGASYVLTGACFWKVATEALWPITGAPFWEFIERGGSYAAPLLLLMVERLRQPESPNLEITQRALTHSEMRGK